MASDLPIVEARGPFPWYTMSRMLSDRMVIEALYSFHCFCSGVAGAIPGDSSSEEKVFEFIL